MRTPSSAAINALPQSLFRRAGDSPEPAPDSICALLGAVGHGSDLDKATRKGRN